MLPTILGICCLILHGKLKKRKYVTYYCEICKDAVGKPRGKKCLCMTCRKHRRELPVRFREWNKLSGEDRDKFISGQ